MWRAEEGRLLDPTACTLPTAPHLPPPTPPPDGRRPVWLNAPRGRWISGLQRRRRAPPPPGQARAGRRTAQQGSSCGRGRRAGWGFTPPCWQPPAATAAGPARRAWRQLAVAAGRRPRTAAWRAHTGRLGTCGSNLSPRWAHHPRWRTPSAPHSFRLSWHWTPALVCSLLCSLPSGAALLAVAAAGVRRVPTPAATCQRLPLAALFFLTTLFRHLLPCWFGARAGALCNSRGLPRERDPAVSCLRGWVRPALAGAGGAWGESLHEQALLGLQRGPPGGAEEGSRVREHMGHMGRGTRRRGRCTGRQGPGGGGKNRVLIQQGGSGRAVSEPARDLATNWGWLSCPCKPSAGERQGVGGMVRSVGWEGKGCCTHSRGLGAA